MRCPGCNNTKTFRRYVIAELEDAVVYDEEGNVDFMDSGDVVRINTVTIECDKCDFLCLPEAFMDDRSANWPIPYRDYSNRWYIKGPEINLYGIAIKEGKIYLDDKVGESYSQLFQIRYSGSLAQLPGFLASELPEVRNSALKKMEELENG